MDHGLESCRLCARKSDLTFHHIISYKKQRNWSMGGVTILCAPCNKGLGNTFVPFASLKDEEDAAPPDKRWSKKGLAFYGMKPLPSGVKERASLMRRGLL